MFVCVCVFEFKSDFLRSSQRCLRMPPKTNTSAKCVAAVDNNNLTAGCRFIYGQEEDLSVDRLVKPSSVARGTVSGRLNRRGRLRHRRENSPERCQHESKQHTSQDKQRTRTCEKWIWYLPNDAEARMAQAADKPNTQKPFLAVWWSFVSAAQTIVNRVIDKVRTLFFCRDPLPFILIVWWPKDIRLSGESDFGFCNNNCT